MTRKYSPMSSVQAWSSGVLGSLDLYTDSS